MTILSQTSRYFHNGISLATTNYIYNSAGGTDSEAGWVSAKADSCLVVVCCATLSATLLTYRVEGRFDTYNRPVALYTASVDAAHSIDQAIVINEKVKELRVGVKVDNVAATPNIFYAGLCLTEQK